jgi:hypothetical protein
MIWMSLEILSRSQSGEASSLLTGTDRIEEVVVA